MASSDPEKLFLGIDIGSVSLACALINERKGILWSSYLFHRGNITNLLREQLEPLDLSGVAQVGHNRRSSDFFSGGISANDQIAVIEGVLFQTSQVGSVFVIGGETFGLIVFDERRQYERYLSNSSCAAGTGAFLEKLARERGRAAFDRSVFLVQPWTGAVPTSPDEIAFLPAHRLSALLKARKVTSQQLRSGDARSGHLGYVQCDLPPRGPDLVGKRGDCPRKHCCPGGTRSPGAFFRRIPEPRVPVGYNLQR